MISRYYSTWSNNLDIFY